MSNREPSRIKQTRTVKQRYGKDFYSKIQKKRWEKPGAKEKATHLFNSETGRANAMKRWEKSKKKGQTDE